MFRPTWKLLLLGAAVAVVLSAAAPQADAFWGCHRGYYGGWGSYYSYSCYSPCYRACYTPCLTRSYYPYGGWYGGHWGHRRALFGCGRSYGGCGWGGGYYDSCCSSVTYGEATPALPAQQPTPAQKPIPEPTFSKPAPALPPDPVPAAPEPTIPAPLSPLEPAPALPGFDTPLGGSSDLPAIPALPDSSSLMPADSALLTVSVPEDAKVTVNGLATKSTGSRRRYVSHGLKPGFAYKYVVRAEVVRDGRTIDETRTITLTTGTRTAVAFGFNADATQSLAAR